MYQEYLELISDLYSKYPTEVVSVGFFGAFAFYRPLYWAFKFKKRRVNRNWQERQGNFFGATEEIKGISEKLALSAWIFVFAKPVLLSSDYYWKTNFIDPIGVLIIGGFILFYYGNALNIFKRREDDGNATKVPFEMKRAWLELSLFRAGFSLKQLYFAGGLIAGHAILNLLYFTQTPN